MDEQRLIQLAAGGDLAAFESLVTLKRDRVFWIAFHTVGDRELARDVSQEVFLRLYRVLPRYRAGESFDPWLYRITVHLGIDALRRERPHRAAAALDEIPDPPADSNRIPGVPGSASESPAAASLRSREVRRIFVELSGRLSPRQRTAFILREIEGMSTGDVARALNTRESTVRNHILQARRTLQAELRRRYPEYCRAPGRRDR